MGLVVVLAATQHGCTSMSADHSSDFFHHVRDSIAFEVPKFLGGPDGLIEIPQIFGGYFLLTKFMLLEVVALGLTYFIFTGLARRVAAGGAVQGRFWNFWEGVALFVRDEVVRPTIGAGHHDDHGDDHGHGEHGHAGHGHEGHGHGVASQAAYAHPGDQYLPFIWSLFFFILFCNLLGAIPFLGSPTGNIWVTGVLAAAVLIQTILAGSKELGVVGFWKALVPSMELPPALKVLLLPMMWVIEFFGLLIKHSVLAVRLFANVMAGHTVIATMLGFIGMVAGSQLFYLVVPASILGQVAIGLLELFVAFLQAYVFAFLATLFIATAVHPH
jgi:F-type H+-transporting ATPase subunit a